MDTNLTLDEAHFTAAADKARALGKSPQQYVQDLIEADTRSFDEILAPVRDGFNAMSDEQADDLLERAQRAARQAK